MQHLVVVIGILTAAAQVGAGPPIAVRHWGREVVSIETYWDLRVAIGPDRAAVEAAGEMPEADLVLIAGAPAGEGSLSEHARRLHGLDAEGEPVDLDLILDRFPNAAQSVIARWSAHPRTSPHAIRVRGLGAAFLVEVNGVRILYASSPEAISWPSEPENAVDVLVVSDPHAATQRGEAIHSRLVLALSGTGKTGKPRPGNTIAVFASDGPAEDVPQVIRLGTRPWPMPAELANLFARKERAARNSAKVFTSLTVEQMNHRPANGSHTPRWNVEHMMGRELGFFTRIYSKRQPGFPAIDLNPAQMPDDYEPAHPDWIGAEEARQIERVEHFVKRFAYLLDGIDLDTPAPGLRWTPRRLLVQMERHWGEHTANVREKFEQPDWPGP